MTALRAETINLLGELSEEDLAKVLEFLKGLIKTEKKITSEKALQAFYTLRAEAKVNGLQKMTLDEINAEIKAAREENL